MEFLASLVAISWSIMLVHENSNITVTKILYYWLSFLDPFRFCGTHLITHPWFVAKKSAIFLFSGGTISITNSITVVRSFERSICAIHTFLISDVTNSITNSIRE